MKKMTFLIAFIILLALPLVSYAETEIFTNYRCCWQRGKIVHACEKFRPFYHMLTGLCYPTYCLFTGDGNAVVPCQCADGI